MHDGLIRTGRPLGQTGYKDDAQNGYHADEHHNKGDPASVAPLPGHATLLASLHGRRLKPTEHGRRF
jgi:hypothetical protein